MIQKRSARLAPSPTGKVHLGNLSSLLLAWVQARALGAHLTMRVEDLDPPRTVEGADAEIMRDLRWLGVEWDSGPGAGGPQGPYYQSQRSALYDRRLAELKAADLVYPCFCSRRDVRDVLSAPHASFDPGTQYPGTCGEAADWDRAERAEHAIRFRAAGLIFVEDGVFGPLEHDVGIRPGDFVVRRRDGLYAYQFAVVVDDAAMGITDVVRGFDLFDSTPRQFALFDALGAPRPKTWHVPLLQDERGERFSKRHRSISRSRLEAVGWDPPSLCGALAWLWGWADSLVSRNAGELVGLWDPSTLARESIRVPDAFFEGPEALRRQLTGE